MNLNGRVARLEERVEPGRCRRCGGRCCPDVATLVRRGDEPACSCGCCAWVADLVAEARR